jgi:hypothetical protein
MFVKRCSRRLEDAIITVHSEDGMRRNSRDSGAEQLKTEWILTKDVCYRCRMLGRRYVQLLHCGRCGSRQSDRGDETSMGPFVGR